MANEEIEKLVTAGIAAARTGKRAEARKLLEQALEADDSNEEAWLALATVVETPRERRICLENVLEINPNNAKARAALEALRPSPSTGTVQSTTTKTPTPARPTAAVPSQSGPMTGAPRPAPRPQQTVQAPTKRAGDTGKATADAWRRQRRTGEINPTFVVIILGGLLIIGIGLFIVATTDAQNQARTATAGPTDLAVTVPVAAQNTAAPTATRNTVNLGELPPDRPAATWTPSPSPSPLPSATPVPTLPPLAFYRVMFVREQNSGQQSRIFIAQGDGTQEQQLVESESKAFDPAFSPDGTRIAFVTLVEGREQIVVAKADGSEVTPLTDIAEGQVVRRPVWSPDGSKIAFYADATGATEIYLMNADGTNRERLTRSRYAALDPAFSPDGKTLVYASDTTGKKSWQLFALNLAATATAPVQLTASAGQNTSPMFSPDGSQIVFVSTRNRSLSKIFVMRADGSDERIVTFDDNSAENRDPAWSPDGNFILFASTRGGSVFNLFITTPNGRNVQQVTQKTENVVRGSFQPGF